MRIVCTFMYIYRPRSTRRYAPRVLAAMKDDRVEELKRKKKKWNAVTETAWPERVKAALLLPTNTRASPGKDSVSIAYGVRREKMILQKPKKQLMEELRALYRDEDPPSVSTLLTLIPANFVRPTARDRQANACVKHSNLTHLSKALRPVLPSLPSASRELAGLVMCPPSETNVFSLLDPLTWRRECALRCSTISEYSSTAEPGDGQARRGTLSSVVLLIYNVSVHQQH